ncbi:MAG TPA: hypothetical protein VFW17_13285 [Ktedonobacterales bacterium]|nr:hypothetical protein [Ktedonobacterales bacterium]
MAQLRVFLSHSSADRDFADALAHALRVTLLVRGMNATANPSWARIPLDGRRLRSIRN